MAPFLTHRARLGPNVSIDITASFLSLAVTVVAVLLLLCAFARRSSGAVTRRRAARGQFAASCGNPQHKLWRSSNSSPLRTATPQILRAVKGGTLRLNRRTKLCEDCLGKLINKPAYRRLFATVRLLHTFFAFYEYVSGRARG